MLTLLLVAFAALLWFLGRPAEPKWIEVDVTDMIAAGAPQ